MRLALLAAMVALCVAPPLNAQEDVRYFRIGAGQTTGNYFAIGGSIATAISNPPGSRPCERGGSCGVPGLIAVAQTTQGSVDNIESLAKGVIEAGLSQSDVAYWAYSGTGMYKGDKAHGDLRAIANLYQESLQIVVRADSGIERIADLKGKRVSLGERGSGTLATATLVLRAYDLAERRIKGVQLPIDEAADQLKAGKIDAVFVVGGGAIPSIADLATEIEIRLLPVDGDKASELRRANPFLNVDLVPDGTYEADIGSTITVGIGTYLMVPATLDDELVYGITKALWHQATRRLLDQGSPVGRYIREENALVGLVVPLHPGASRYYEEARQRTSGTTN